MQNSMLRLYPFLCLLLLFSCAKDNDLSSFEQAPETLQARDRGWESPCNMICKQPDFVQVNQITGCSAEVTWGFESDYCGSFIVHLQNLTTGDWRFFDPATSPLQLWSLEPCTEYTVGISHVTDICASVPLEYTFKTDCERCECNEDCKILDYAYVDEVGENAAVIKFGFNEIGKTCGKFVAQLKNNNTGIITYIDPAHSPLVLSGLNSCTSYTIGVFHVTDLQACFPTKLDFTTSCEDGPCEAKGLIWEDANINELFFDHHTTGTVTILNSFGLTGGYVYITNPIVNLQANTPFGIAFCFNLSGPHAPGDVKVKIWIDYDGDNQFELNEVVTDYSYLGASSACVPPQPALVLPSQEICGVRGRAIFSVDNGEILSPCEDVPLGRVFDFLVNIGDCDAHN